MLGDGITAPGGGAKRRPNVSSAAFRTCSSIGSAKGDGSVAGGAVAGVRAAPLGPVRAWGWFEK